MAESAYRVEISGVVQGVGFRPYIFRLAKKFCLKGYVSNTSKGVLIHIEGEEGTIRKFLESIQTDKPEISYIESIDVYNAGHSCFMDFTIRNSKKCKENNIYISNDLSTCKECRNDIFDPGNRRYRYPFTTCTYCGPRYSIIRDIPYDRQNTVMDEFNMCCECQSEYDDPSDRRYHSQPNACSKCGPVLSLYNTKEDDPGGLNLNDPIEHAVSVLKHGKIIAVKGLGGYLLCCDALDPDVVRELRKRKLRDLKPFAIMCRDLETAYKYCHISSGEEEILSSPNNPIVLLKKREGNLIAPEVSIDNDYLGLMLPYTPVHLLLMDKIEVLVMTSANISDMPIISDDDEALKTLSKIADYILVHNRKIHRRVDDSVFKVINALPQAIRRARGYTPGIIKAKGLKKPILAVGGELKTTFAMNRDDNILVSPHIGDLKYAETFDLFKKSIYEFERLFGISPEIVACDMHPGYLSTVWAEENFRDVVRVQHHHAHLAGTLLESGLTSEEAIGIAMDGTGFGTDGAIWGCECGVVSFREFRRRGHLDYFKLPGGDKCSDEIFRCAISLIRQTFGDLDSSKYKFLKNYDLLNIKILQEMMDKNINSVPTSSMGRLFDGISCILGLGNYSKYEASAAILLERYADLNIRESYLVKIVNDGNLYKWDWKNMIEEIVDDLHKNLSIQIISSKFHNSVIDYIIKMVRILYEETGLKKVVLSGGVFNNSVISSRAETLLSDNGFEVSLQRIFPGGDGGICLGQLIIANEVI